MDLLMLFFIAAGMVGFGLLAGAARPRDEMRNRSRWGIHLSRGGS